MALKEYRRKRKFEQTPEPAGKPKRARPARAPMFVVQKHAARRLHYDLRLEIDGALKSWAVPKGPSLNPADKRLAVQTEDHPMEYGGFEGVIPEGNYGAGTVQVWDTGTYRLEDERPAAEQVARGEIKFALEGQKLRGGFVLVKLKAKGAKGGGQDWLLIKHKDADADPEWDVEKYPESAVTGRTLEEIRQGLPPDQATRAGSADALEGAEEAAMPSKIQPLLATLVEHPFSDPDWLFELKWDGIRALAWVDHGRTKLQSRMGRDVTSHYPELESFAQQLSARQAIVDGEIVVLDENGRASFERLQSRMNVARPSAAMMAAAPITYYVFDLLYCDGYDLRAAPLAERKRLLKQVLRAKPPVRYSDHVFERGEDLFELAKESGAEGIVGKQIHSGYTEGRSTSWVKFKITQEVDAVVGGYTAPRGGRTHLGALLLGLYDDSGLVYVGGVGSGFGEKTLDALRSKLQAHQSDKCPFVEEPKTKEAAHWVSPELVARVKFHEWTNEVRLRQPVFVGLREDKDPAECRLASEAPQQRPAPVIVKAVSAVPQLSGRREIEAELFDGKQENVLIEIDGKAQRLSNLNKVYFPEPGYTKRDLLAHYYRVADYLLPFLRDRPMVLNRFPNGVGGKSFYQKDSGEDVPAWMETFGVYSEERQRETRFFLANDLAALLYLANLGCIEMHPWSSRIDEPQRPDYVFFDLDPVEGTEFSTVMDVAREVYDILQTLELRVFLKTSGASGFHMYLPLERDYDYEHARAFAEIVARVVAAQIPKKVTLERLTGKRAAGRVYIDYSQNAYGRPLASVYSVRPFPLGTVGAPVAPRELRRTLKPSRFTIGTMPERLKKAGDLWAGFFESRQRVEPALERLQAMIQQRQLTL